MRSHPKRSLCVLFSLFLTACLLTGCGAGRGIYANYRAVEDLQTVQTLGLDFRSDGSVTVTAAVGKAGDSGSPAILRCSGRSIPEALESLQDYTERGQLFFAHVQYLLLGQDMAAFGLNEVLDYVERDVHTRMGAELFVLRDGRAEDFLSAAADGDRVSELLASVKRDTELRGGSHVYDVRSTAVTLSEYGTAAICALRMVPTEGSVLSDAPEYTVVPDGYGILKHGVLVCFLDGADAEVFSLLSGDPGTVNCSIPDGEGGTVTLELSGRADYSVLEADLTEISVRAEAVISAVDSPNARITDGDYLQRLSDTVSAELEERALRVLALSKSLDADFLSLARHVQLYSGTPSLPENWLQQMEFRLKTETVMAHSYDLREPLGMEGEA